MALRKEIAQRMKEVGFTKNEIADFADAKKPDGTPQDLELVIQSATFEHMLDSRKKWMENALKSKQFGGMGLTYRGALKVIDNFYVMTGRRKLHRDIWSWMKLSYRPKEKIQSKKQFQHAITFKSVVGKQVGRNYGDKLKIRYSPTRYCSHCHGTGKLLNLERRYIDCIYCGGTGVSRKRFI